MSLQATKYAVLGRSVLLIDATHVGKQIDDAQLQEMSIQLTDTDFGAGSNLVAYVCELDTEVKGSSQALGVVPSELDTLLTDNSVDRAIVCRTFLPSGHELVTSAEAHCAITEHVNRISGQSRTWIADGFNCDQPRLYNAFRDLNKSLCTVNTRLPHRLPEQYKSELYNDVAVSVPEVNNLELLTIHVRDTSWEEDRPLNFLAVAVGEPYLICFVDRTLRQERYLNEPLYDIFERPRKIQERLLQNIATAVNGYGDNESPPLLPFGALPARPTTFNSDLGVNVVFVQVSGADSLDVRYYCRGIYQEVRLQGGAAVAVSFVAQRLGGVVSSPVFVRSLRNIQDGRYQAAAVKHTGSSWWFTAPVVPIWEGLTIEGY